MKKPPAVKQGVIVREGTATVVPPLVNVSVVLVACLGEKSLGLEDMLLAHDVTRRM